MNARLPQACKYGISKDMKLTLYQIDAFAGAVFKGNPAAICPLEKWLDDDLMQAIAVEKRHSSWLQVMPMSYAGSRQRPKWTSVAMPRSLRLMLYLSISKKRQR